MPLLRRCGCNHDGMAGMFCEEPIEMYCANQCSGHGACVYGFCKCDGGWYGHDCSRKVAGQEMEPGGWRAPAACWARRGRLGLRMLLSGDGTAQL